MLEDQPQEPGAGERGVFDPFRLAILVAKGHLAVFAGDDILFLDHAFIEIASKIDQRLLAGADGLDVHDPGLGVFGRQFKILLSDGVEHFGAKDLGQSLVVEQIGVWVVAFSFFAAFGPPSLVICIDGCGGHHQMHMRVVVEAA